MLLINQEWGHYREISDQGHVEYMYIKAEVWDFPVMTEWMSLKGCLLYGLFIMDLSMW